MYRHNIHPHEVERRQRTSEVKRQPQTLGEHPMGLFSLFKLGEPGRLADELFAASMDMTLTPEERAWVPKLYVEEHRYIAERNLLRMGMTEGGVALAAGVARRSNAPRSQLAQKLRERYLSHFSQMGNVTPDEGRHFYQCASNRYIVRTPEEMVLIFHYYLQCPGHWADTRQETSPPSAIPENFQAFLHKLMKTSFAYAIDRANSQPD